MEVLLEVVTEREVQERAAVRRELHAGREAALDHGQVARGQMAVQLGDVRPDVQTLVARQRRRIDPRPGHHDHPERRHDLLRTRIRLDHPAQEVRTHARAAHRDHAHLLVRSVSQLVAEGRPVGEGARVEPRDVVA